eukprot:CAMPEP_0201115722 /NCGR_PEP_ID=MMETSP0850-20130426/87_1 /ASSEMBLY_ACC=CAM_ASM_000622 /TAXON_ID=183588 /ORGANISM="Pseudo-nitzschia fraudulenta, Strain WWA7" /LENGTH=98 /DNA_ID=CAMNT_0047379481 /DNA_START=46 /DNA_END=339 /DNA_ORIENTATION=+
MNIVLDYITFAKLVGLWIKGKEDDPQPPTSGGSRLVRRLPGAVASPGLPHHDATHLCVGDRVEEVVVARVQARVHHATGDTKHGSTSVLDLNIEGTVA